jgi:hypothetical protein
MKPSVGRIVYYTNLGDKDGKYQPEQQAAIITGVYPGRPAAPGHEFDSMEVDLHIFYRTGQFDMQKVPFSGTYERGHWSWPARV